MNSLVGFESRNEDAMEDNKCLSNLEKQIR